jgi:hypothetical protein
VRHESQNALQRPIESQEFSKLYSFDFIFLFWKYFGAVPMATHTLPVRETMEQKLAKESRLSE